MVRGFVSEIPPSFQSSCFWLPGVEVKVESQKLSERFADFLTGT